MPGNALLIGSALDGLAGVGGDLDAMDKALTDRGLAVRRCEGADATRAGILAACEQLIEDARPGEASVLYYSGHGGWVTPPPAGTPGPDLMDMQFIAPVDFHEYTADDFRGITSVELSVLLTRLTQVTDNATAIFDCCHAARMSRKLTARARVVPEPPPYELVRDHIERMRTEGKLQINMLRATGDPKLVRVAACAPEQTAFEYTGDGGQRIGMMTESLAMALEEAGSEPVTWTAVLDRVRRRVLTLEISQRPEVAGPSRRLLFDTAEADILTTLPVSVLSEDRVALECAALLGVRPGDRFLIMPPDSAVADDQASIGSLQVELVGPMTAEGPIVFREGRDKVPLGARAFRVAAAASALPVLLPSDDPRAATLAKRVAAQPLLRLPEPGEQWLAAVRIGPDGSFGVEDPDGKVYPQRPGDEAGLRRVVQDLTTVAQANALRELSGNEKWALGAQVDFTWGLVQDGERRPLPESGASVRVGQRAYLSVHNRGQELVHVSLIDIGVAGKITVLTDFSPLGLSLGPGREYVFGFDDYAGVLVGEPLAWPDGIDPAQARTETVLALVTSQPQDVSMLGQQGVTRKGNRPDTPLEALLRQTRTGGLRDLGSRSGPAVRYDVHKIDFEVGWVPDEGRFLIDERPGPVELHRADRIARGTDPAVGQRPAEPTVVAVRIEELVIQRNRALFFGSDIRLDAIVLTATSPTDPPAYQAHTARFANIRRGESLPLDRMLVYYGPAVDYLDLALWVSRDAPDTRGLGELLSDETSTFEMQDAMAKLSQSAGLPYVGAAVTALGLSTVVVNVAYKLLRGAVSDVIGLYRGSMLEHEHFGAGRHPAEGVREVQDLSLAFTIEEIPVRQ